MWRDFCPLAKDQDMGCVQRECALWAETEDARGCALRVLAEALARLAAALEGGCRAGRPLGERY